MKFCPSCGHTMTDQEHFCPQCGSAVAAPPPPPPMYTPPVYTAPVSPLMRDLKACIVGLSVSALWVLLFVLELAIPDITNEWFELLMELLIGGATASFVFASVHCQKVCAWLTTIPYFTFELLFVFWYATHAFDYSYSDIIPFIIGRILWILLPVIVLLIVGLWRKRRPPEMVQSMALLLAFGLQVLITAIQNVIHEVIPQGSYASVELYDVVYLCGELYIMEIAGFAAVYAISWYMLKRRERRFG